MGPLAGLSWVEGKLTVKRVLVRLAGPWPGLLVMDAIDLRRSANTSPARLIRSASIPSLATLRTDPRACRDRSILGRRWYSQTKSYVEAGPVRSRSAP